MPKRGATFLSDFRLFFLKGLAIVLPTVITAGLLFWAYNFLNDYIASPINSAVRWGVVNTAPYVLPEENMPEWWHDVPTLEEVNAERSREGARPIGPVAYTEVVRSARMDNLRGIWQGRWYLQAIGFIVALVLIYLAGVFFGNIIGRRIWRRIELFMTSVPLIKQVYPNVKQVTDFLLGSDEQAFPRGRVIVCEYPRKGIYTVGLMTGPTMKAIEEYTGVPSVTVFIPSSPTPFTGYTITLPREDVYELPVSMDETLRFVVSGGVLVPSHQTIHRDWQERVDDVELPSAPDLAGSGEGGIMTGASDGDAPSTEEQRGPARPPREES